MRPTKFLKELRLRRVRVRFVADGQGKPLRVRCEAPVGTFTASMEAALQRHKPYLLRLLEAEEREERQGPKVPPHLRTCAWREVLRPDLREPLGLEPLDHDPPEFPPHPRLVWVRDLGCWQDGNVIVSTQATQEARDRYYRVKSSWEEERKEREEACIKAMCR